MSNDQYEPPQELIDRAIKTREAGSIESTLGILSDIVDNYPGSIKAFMIMGDVLWDLGRLDEAIAIFKKAVDLNPIGSTMSFAVFHCNCNKGDYIAAFDEIRRFWSAGGVSEDYDQILKELWQNHPDLRPLIPQKDQQGSPRIVPEKEWEYVLFKDRPKQGGICAIEKTKHRAKNCRSQCY